MNQPIEPKTLVVYFSRAGHTRKVAEAVAHAAHADIEELRETHSRRGVFGWVRSDYEAAFKLSAHPLPLMRDLRKYQLVFLGSPTWHGALSSPVRGFLEQNGTSLNDVALFVTFPERGPGETIAQMSELVPRPPLSVLRISESDVNRGPAVEVGNFVEQTLLAWEERHASAEAAKPAERYGSG
jgi:flavodoxin